MDEPDIQRDLDFVLEVLEELEYVVQASGAIAETGTVIEVMPHGEICIQAKGVRLNKLGLWRGSEF